MSSEPIAAVAAELRAIATRLDDARPMLDDGRREHVRALVGMVLPSLLSLAGRLAQAWRDAGPKDIRERMTELAETFPGLRGRAGVRPWDAGELDAWAARDDAGSGALHAARFVLSVWFPSHSWSAGPFIAHSALGAWDPEHRAAFLAWAADPWWP